MEMRLRQRKDKRRQDNFLLKKKKRQTFVVQFSVHFDRYLNLRTLKTTDDDFVSKRYSKLPFRTISIFFFALAAARAVRNRWKRARFFSSRGG